MGDNLSIKITQHPLKRDVQLLEVTNNGSVIPGFMIFERVLVNGEYVIYPLQAKRVLPVCQRCLSIPSIGAFSAGPNKFKLCIHDCFPLPNITKCIQDSGWASDPHGGSSMLLSNNKDSSQHMSLEDVYKGFSLLWSNDLVPKDIIGFDESNQTPVWSVVQTENFDQFIKWIKNFQQGNIVQSSNVDTTLAIVNHNYDCTKLFIDINTNCQYDSSILNNLKVVHGQEVNSLLVFKTSRNSGYSNLWSDTSVDNININPMEHSEVMSSLLSSHPSIDHLDFIDAGAIKCRGPAGDTTPFNITVGPKKSTGNWKKVIPSNCLLDFIKIANGKTNNTSTTTNTTTTLTDDINRNN